MRNRRRRVLFCDVIFLLQIVEIERAIGFANVHLADDDAFFFKRAPGRDVGVVIESGDDDFVARFQIAADGTREREA